MPDAISLNRRHVSVPFALLLTGAASLFGAGGTYAVMRGDIAAGVAQSHRIEAASIERDNRIERRVEKLEDVQFRTLDFMARIDERMAAQSKIMESVQRDMADLKQRKQ